MPKVKDLESEIHHDCSQRQAKKIEIKILKKYSISLKKKKF